jgi:hypothetical protein
LVIPAAVGSEMADALGHDAGFYRARGRVALLRRELDWLQEQEVLQPFQ